MATDFQTLLNLNNDPCYLNQPPGIQRAIRLAILQVIANEVAPTVPTDYQSLLSATNVACYLNLPYELQQKIKLALLQLIANGGGGGGGGGGPWNPNTPGTIVEWLQADKILQSTGSAVAVWPHSAGVDALAAGAAQPTFITAAQNNLPIVRYNGSTNFSVAAGFVGQNLPFTVAIAFRYQGSVSTFSSFLQGGLGQFLLETDNASGDFLIYNGAGIATIPVDNAFHILFIVLNGATSKYGFDGAALTTISAGTLSGTTSIALGGRADGTSLSQVDIGEVMIWSGDGSSFYNSAYTYLNNRWA